MNISKEKLEELISDFNIEVYDSVNSTNNVAKQKLPKTLIVARSQTLGRGRLGKSFFSPTGGIYISFVMPEVTLATLRTAVAVCRTLNKFSAEKVAVKWVNDIFSNGKKVSGILCERASGGIVAGIGININRSEFPDDIPIAGSVCVTADREALIADIAKELLSLWDMADDAVLAEYKSLLFMLGRSVNFVLNNIPHSGIAFDINSDGNLLVRERDTVHILNSGEITLGSNMF